MHTDLLVASIVTHRNETSTKLGFSHWINRILGAIGVRFQSLILTWLKSHMLHAENCSFHNCRGFVVDPMIPIGMLCIAELISNRCTVRYGTVRYSTVQYGTVCTVCTDPTVWTICTVCTICTTCTVQYVKTVQYVRTFVHRYVDLQNFYIYIYKYASNILYLIW